MEKAKKELWKKEEKGAVRGESPSKVKEREPKLGGSQKKNGGKMQK